jgi:hypothetical protein
MGEQGRAIGVDITQIDCNKDVVKTMRVLPFVPRCLMKPIAEKADTVLKCGLAEGDWLYWKAL